MSLFSDFITNQAVSALETEVLKHAPDIQTAFVNEVIAFTQALMSWAECKLKSCQSSNPTSGDNAS